MCLPSVHIARHRLWRSKGAACDEPTRRARSFGRLILDKGPLTPVSGHFWIQFFSPDSPGPTSQPMFSATRLVSWLVFSQMRAAEAKSAAAADEMTVQMNRRSTAERLLAEAEATNQAQGRRVAEAVQMEHELHACRAALQSCEGLVSRTPFTLAPSSSSSPKALCSSGAKRVPNAPSRFAYSEFFARSERGSGPLGKAAVS